MIHRFIFAFLLSIAFGLLPGNSSEVFADAVFMTDGSIIFGRLIERTEDTIVFNQRISEPWSDDLLSNRSGLYRERTIPLGEVASLVINIKVDRLEALDPSDPTLYRDLAEELATQKSDPEARELAIRLFLIAAKLGNKVGNSKVRSTSFSALIGLARSGDEQKRFRALAHTFSDDNRSWLGPIGENPSSEFGPSVPSGASSVSRAAQTPQRRQLLSGLVALRQGNRAEAARLLDSSQFESDWIDETMRPFASICSAQDIDNWSGAAELKIEWLALLLELEIAIRNPDWDKQSHNSTTRDWSVLVHRNENRSDQKRTPSTINFFNATEFNPDLVRFKNGKWTDAP